MRRLLTAAAVLLSLGSAAVFTVRAAFDAAGAAGQSPSEAGATTEVESGRGMLAAVRDAVRRSPEAPPLTPNNGWLNIDRPLDLHEDLDGHVVLLDFWTYCCINCIHVVPDLEYLEKKYADEPFVVIGVHSAKFEAEKELQNIRDAIHRYGKKHPVVVDSDFKIWRQYGVRAWPTFVLIGPDGSVDLRLAGEGHRQQLDRAIGRLIREGRANGTLADAKVEYEIEELPTPETGLRFPGKVLAVPPSEEEHGEDGRWWRNGAVFIADSSHHRVVAARWPEALSEANWAQSAGGLTLDVVSTFGTGEEGLTDGRHAGARGDAPKARFADPHGMTFDPVAGALFVADTKNHAVRRIDMAAGEVTTLLGTGERGRDLRGGGRGTGQPIASPWALAIANTDEDDSDELLIAMAGTHQLWDAEMDDWRARRVAGSGRESIIDAPGPRAALAQPSGIALSSDGTIAYFTDTEGSAVRAFDLRTGEVRTIIGVDVSNLGGFGSPLFEFGDIDGSFPDARLQHAIGITRSRTETGEDRLFIADTYNNKLKIIDPESRTVRTWADFHRRDITLDEPAGVSYAETSGGGVLFIADTNHHRIIAADPATGRSRLVEVRFPGDVIE